MSGTRNNILDHDDSVRPLRVVVCGSTFGQVYLRALQSGNLPFELAGLLAQGSDRSQACAHRFNVPLYTDVAQLPDDINAACVVIRSGVMGGRGTELAQVLMARGLHVMQEHPLHHDELKACLAQAHRYGVQYRVNTFYTTLEPVRNFLHAATRLLACRRPLFVDAACAIQVAYPLFDILGQMLGQLRPWELQAIPAVTNSGAVYRSLEGRIAGLPFTLRVQNQIDPSDPDGYLHLLHRITLGTDGGSLTLMENHGPVFFQPTQHLPIELRDAFDLNGLLPEHLDFASSTQLGAVEAPNFRQIFGVMWPASVHTALCEWYSAIASGTDPRKLGQYQLAVSRIWQDTTTALGYPDTVDQVMPQSLDGTVLVDPVAVDKEIAL